MEHIPQWRDAHKFLDTTRWLLLQRAIASPSLPAHRTRVVARSFRAGQALLLIFIAILVTSLIMPLPRNAQANVTIPYGYACNWRRIQPGDTLSAISSYYRANTGSIARANHIHNPNIIFAGQQLCIPYKASSRQSYNHSYGIAGNGSVRWYAYDALEQSNHRQVVRLLRQAAARHGLPANLLLAIAWQESGWRQHVIARDGGIGTMQIMPYTAQVLNRMVGRHYDPYRLVDNIELGAIYLKTLHYNFRGNMTKVISAYNEGGWNVVHRGIFNWRYVNNVRWLMNRY